MKIFKKKIKIELGKTFLGNRIIEAHYISKSINDKLLFKDFSYIAKPGDRIGLIGPNGCGKSTLTKIISGIISDYSGDVSVKNRNIRELSFFEMSKIVSYLPQKIFYDPDITVIESLISVLSKDFTFEFGPKQKKQIEKKQDDRAKNKSIGARKRWMPMQ